MAKSLHAGLRTALKDHLELSVTSNDNEARISITYDRKSWPELNIGVGRATLDLSVDCNVTATLELSEVDMRSGQGGKVNLDIVISSAATVVFDEPIDMALSQNAIGLRRVLEFTKGCRDASFVYVSTAYVNGMRTGPIPEALIPPDVSVAHQLGNGTAAAYDLDEQIAEIEAFSSRVREEAELPARKKEFEAQLARQNRGKRVTPHRLEHQLDALRDRWIQSQLVGEGLRRGRQHGWNDAYTDQGDG